MGVVGDWARGGARRVHWADFSSFAKRESPAGGDGRVLARASWLWREGCARISGESAVHRGYLIRLYSS